MNSREGQCVSRQPTLPPFSNRTLHHPTFLPLYMSSGFGRHHTELYHQTVHPIIPAEFYYTDPTGCCGQRIPNIVTELGVFDCFQLNTPPPIMSTCPAPPTRRDPFRAGPHPTRDLGRLTLNTNQVQSRRVVLELTQEEDQAITNLLKLHHHKPEQRDETLAAAQMDFSSDDLFIQPELPCVDVTSAEKEYEPFCSDVQDPGEASCRSQLQQGRCWSEPELEAANTLLSRFSLMEEDKTRSQDHNKSAAALPDPLLYHQHEDSPTSTGTQQTSTCAQDDVSWMPACAVEFGEPGRMDFVPVEGVNTADVHVPVCESSPSSAPGDLSEAKEWTLSVSEGDAVHVLLSLGDTGAFEAMQ